KPLTQRSRGARQPPRNILVAVEQEPTRFRYRPDPQLSNPTRRLHRQLDEPREEDAAVDVLLEGPELEVRNPYRRRQVKPAWRGSRMQRRRLQDFLAVLQNPLDSQHHSRRVSDFLELRPLAPQ